jgi:4-hydroxy-tetrahydrodipicolinate synthase
MIAGSLVALVTPMRRDGAVDFDALSRLVEFHASAGTAGIVVGGTTGESATLTDPELREITRHTLARADGRLKVLAGAGTSSTSQTVDRARALAALGVDGLLVVTPSYNRPTQEGLYRHFAAVAAASDAPIVLYNVPSRTAVDLLPATVERLARVPGVAGIKEAVASVDRIRDLVRAAGPQFAVLSGDDATAREAVLAGACGVISVTANCAPRDMAGMIAAARAGHAEAAARLDAPLARLHETLFIEPNPIPVKWALAAMGLIADGIRLPLTWLEPAHEAALREALEGSAIATRRGAA